MKKIIVLLAILGMFLVSCDINAPKDTKTEDENTEENNNTDEKTNFEKWKSSKDATDYDENGEITEEDYKIYILFSSWLDSNDALDFNSDRRINYKDYLIFTAYSLWRHSDEAIDLNGDKKIDYDDYLEFLEYLEWKNGTNAIDLDLNNTIDIQDYITFNSKEYKNYVKWKESVKDSNLEINYDDYLKFNTWLDSDDGKDLNDDRVIDYNDYFISLNPSLTDYEKWLLSNNHIDYTGDNMLDEKDFYLYSLFGEYKIIEYSCEATTELAISNGELSLNNLGNYLDDVILEFGQNGLVIITTDELNEQFSQEIKSAKKIADKVVVTPLSKLVTEISLTANIVDEEIDVSFNLSKESDGKYYTLFKIKYPISSDRTGDLFIEFKMSKIVE